VVDTRPLRETRWTANLEIGLYHQRLRPEGSWDLNRVESVGCEQPQGQVVTDVGLIPRNTQDDHDCVVRRWGDGHTPSQTEGVHLAGTVALREVGQQDMGLHEALACHPNNSLPPQQ
jgi:hypothetical protein